jgi:hypothetical protein
MEGAEVLGLSHALPEIAALDDNFTNIATPPICGFLFQQASKYQSHSHRRTWCEPGGQNMNKQEWRANTL